MLFCLSLSFAQAPDSLKLERIDDVKNIIASNDTIFIKKNDSMVFKINKEATLIDSLWMSELVKSPLYDTTQYVLKDDEIIETELADLPTELLKERLKELDSQTPFHIEYNPQLENIIKTV